MATELFYDENIDGNLDCSIPPPPDWFDENIDK